LGLRASEDLADIAFELPGTQISEFNGKQIAVHAQHGRHADRQMYVGAALLRAKLEKRVDTRQDDHPSREASGYCRLFSPGQAAESISCGRKFDVTHEVWQERPSPLPPRPLRRIARGPRATLPWTGAASICPRTSPWRSAPRGPAADSD